jgi:4'-phosphopantetheinyl transferase
VLKRARVERQQRGSRGGLRKGEVHVVSASLSLPEDEVTRLLSTLSPDEQKRAGKFYFESDRRQFVVCRGVLRSILGTYLGATPSEVRFVYGSNGKPSLDPQIHPAKIEFNVARSQDLALFAIALGVPVGVDVETASSRVRTDQVPKNLFSTAQLQRYAKLREAQKIDFLLRCWTRKEALVKAIGKGLAWPLDSFHVSARARVQSVRIDEERHAGKWSIYRLNPTGDFVGALAVRGKLRALRTCEWDEMPGK